jgi:hypothetical protein
MVAPVAESLKYESIPKKANGRMMIARITCMSRLLLCTRLNISEPPEEWVESGYTSPQMHLATGEQRVRSRRIDRLRQSHAGSRSSSLSA